MNRQHLTTPRRTPGAHDRLLYSPNMLVLTKNRDKQQAPVVPQPEALAHPRTHVHTPKNPSRSTDHPIDNAEGVRFRLLHTGNSWRARIGRTRVVGRRKKAVGFGPVAVYDACARSIGGGGMQQRGVRRSGGAGTRESSKLSYGPTQEST